MSLRHLEVAGAGEAGEVSSADVWDRSQPGGDGDFRNMGGFTLWFFKSLLKILGKWWFNGGLMGFNQQNGDFNGMYPLVICYIAMENGHRNSEFSH